MADPLPVARPAMAVGITRQWPVPSCALKLADLHRLFDILNSKASEAASEQLAHTQRSASQTDLEFASLREEVRNLMGLTVRIQGASGEWRFANSVAAISEDSLPAVVTNIFYECGPLYRARFNLYPQNQFSVAIDFTRTQLGDLSNLALGAGLGPSIVYVSGVNSTWVNAVDHELRAFFAERATRRGWLHSRFAYDLALFFVGFPACLDAIYNFDKRLTALVKLPQAVFVALYVYLVLIGLLGFRILFNYAKWVFPKIEGPPHRSGGATFHKTFLSALCLALVIRVVTTALWIVGIHLH
jgi:hypothetical protein